MHQFLFLLYNSLNKCVLVTDAFKDWKCWELGAETNKFGAYSCFCIILLLL